MYTCYYKPGDVVARSYYDYWRHAGRHAKLLGFVEDHEGTHFLKHYRLAAEIFRHLQPYAFLHPGDTAVQVGFHDQYIDLGISQPLIMAAVVGETGRVLALDPDDTNVAAMLRYMKTQPIPQLSVCKQGVWSAACELAFVVFDDYSSSNTVSTVFDTFRDGAAARWGARRIEEHSRIERIPVDALDSVLEAQLPAAKIDFVNITVNGAEGEVLRGMQRTIAGNPGLRIAFPLSNASRDALDRLQAAGFLLAVCDAPHRPWDREQFFHACAVRCSPQALITRGFQAARIREVTRLSEDAAGKFEVELEAAP